MGNNQMSRNTFTNLENNGVVLHSSSRRKRVLTAQQRRKYLEKFKNKLKSPKVKFMAMMKLGLQCMKENERFIFKLPMAYYMRVVQYLSKQVGDHNINIIKRYGDAVNIKTVNSLRNKIAVKNAFMKYVVRDSLPWAKRQIKEEMGKFGSSKFVVREYYEEIEKMNNETGQIEPKNEDQIKEKKTEPKKEEKKEDIKVNRIYLNPEKEKFVNEPIHKPHLSNECIFIRNQLVKYGFSNLESFEGEFLGLFIKPPRMFSKIQDNSSNGIY